MYELRTRWLLIHFKHDKLFEEKTTFCLPLNQTGYQCILEHVKPFGDYNAFEEQKKQTLTDRTNKQLYVLLDPRNSTYNHYNTRLYSSRVRFMLLTHWRLNL